MELVVEKKIRLWWVFILRGIAFIILGIYMVSSPSGSFAALGFLFGLIILLTGLAELVRVVQDHNKGSRAMHLILGIIDIILGIILLGHIAAGETILRIIVGLWFLFRGISLLSFSGITGRSWLITLGGIITIIFALMIIFNQVFGTVTIVLWIAISFIIIGIFNLYVGYLAKKVAT